MEVAISVIMPVYNMERYLAAAIDSILNQHFRDFEFIIVNDGSTDTSREIMNSYLHDSRLSLINLSRQHGNNIARNIGIRQARGRYICMMDADDIAHPDRLRIEYAYLESHPDILAAGTQYSFIGSHYKPVKSQDYHRIREVLLDHNCFLHPSLIIRSDVLRSVGGYDENFIYSADYDLMCRLALRGIVVNLPESLMYYRLHAQQISSAHHAEQLQYAHTARCRYQLALINQLVERADVKSVALSDVTYSFIGQAIYYFVCAKVYNCERYEKKGEQMLNAACENIYVSDVISMDEKLLAIRKGVRYLLSNRLVEGDEDEILAEINEIST